MKKPVKRVRLRLKLRHDFGSADPIFTRILCDTHLLAWAAETPTSATNHERRDWYQQTERCAWRLLTTYLTTGHCGMLDKLASE